MQGNGLHLLRGGERIKLSLRVEVRGVRELELQRSVSVAFSVHLKGDMLGLH